MINKLFRFPNLLGKQSDVLSSNKNVLICPHNMLEMNSTFLLLNLLSIKSVIYHTIGGGDCFCKSYFYVPAFGIRMEHTGSKCWSSSTSGVPAGEGLSELCDHLHFSHSDFMEEKLMRAASHASC